MDHGLPCFTIDSSTEASLWTPWKGHFRLIGKVTRISPHLQAPMHGSLCFSSWGGLWLPEWWCIKRYTWNLMAILFINGLFQLDDEPNLYMETGSFRPHFHTVFYGWKWGSRYMIAVQARTPVLMGFTGFLSEFLKLRGGSFLQGGGNSNIFYFYPEPLGMMIQFDEHIFQMGGSTPS